MFYTLYIEIFYNWLAPLASAWPPPPVNKFWLRPCSEVIKATTKRIYS